MNQNDSLFHLRSRVSVVARLRPWVALLLLALLCVLAGQAAAEPDAVAANFDLGSLNGPNGIRIAGLARDRFGTLLALGVTVLFGVHVFVNIAMTIGLVPITGIPLPFISYGVRSLLIFMLGIGLAESVAMRYRKLEF